MRPLDEQMKGEYGALIECRGTESNPGAGKKRESVRVRVANGVHRVSKVAVGTWRIGKARRIGGKEVVPVVCRRAERARGPDLDRYAGDDEDNACRQHHWRLRERIREAARRDAEEREAHGVVVHQERGNTAEPLEPSVDSSDAGEDLGLLLPLEHQADAAGVRNSAEEMVRNGGYAPAGHAMWIEGQDRWSVSMTLADAGISGARQSPGPAAASERSYIPVTGTLAELTIFQPCNP